MTIRVLSVFGTRPEAIKMAPVVQALSQDSRFVASVCVTAQHRQMLDQVLSIFDIKPDFDLDLMKPGQDLGELTGRIVTAVQGVLRADRPDWILVQGDTTTCMAAALAAFYERVAIGHVEAGLRSGRLDAPFPEEANRRIVSQIADLHFAPTDTASRNLVAEGFDKSRIIVTGNTVIDALLRARDRVQAMDPKTWRAAIGDALASALEDGSRRVVLITGHRRENFGQGMKDLCTAIKSLADGHPDWLFVYPVHLNPNVQQPVRSILDGVENVHLIEPLDYLAFARMMDRSHLILTDSGGIQEEASSLRKPVLVMRDVTERTEAVDAGLALLVGTNTERIVRSVEQLMLDPAAYRRMTSARNPYGDGTAARAILDAIWQRQAEVGAAARRAPAR